MSWKTGISELPGGWPIYWNDSTMPPTVRYVDTDALAICGSRPCRLCNRAYTICAECGSDDHDPCLGHLPDVVSACCGHGVKEAHAWTRADINSFHACMIERMQLLRARSCHT